MNKTIALSFLIFILTVVLLIAPALGYNTMVDMKSQPISSTAFEETYPQAVQDKLDKNYVVYLIRHNSEEGYYIATLKGDVKEFSIIYNCNPDYPAAEVLMGDTLNYVGDGYKVSKIN